MRNLPLDTIIITGGASGADRIAAEAASYFKLPGVVDLPEWERYGRRAGFLRNIKMLERNPHLVIAFQKNGSRGTQHTIDEAQKRGIEVEVYTE